MVFGSWGLITGPLSEKKKHMVFSWSFLRMEVQNVLPFARGNSEKIL
jgi:hypothetical protein